MIKNLEKYLAGALLLAVALLMPNVSFSYKYKDANRKTDGSDSNKSLDIKDCDFMYVRGSTLYFYSVKNMDYVAYEGEKDEIVNCVFLPNTLKLYYSVCRDSVMLLRCIDFASSEPKPRHVVNWGLTCNDCITETYGTYSGLYLGNGNRYISIWHGFSWDSYDFTNVKVFDMQTTKFIEDESKYELTYSDYEQEDIFDRFYQDTEYPDTDKGKITYKFVSKNEAGEIVCLSDKLKFESDPEEYYLVSVSPTGDRVVFAAVTGWGDYPHGPYCVASTDGKMQIILKGTDISVDDGPTVHWLDDGSLVYVANWPEGKRSASGVMLLPATGKRKPVSLVNVGAFIPLPKIK